jgi:hypothetical protein
VSDEERELIELMRLLAESDRAAVRHLLHSLADALLPQSVH